MTSRPACRLAHRLLSPRGPTTRRELWRPRQCRSFTESAPRRRPHTSSKAKPAPQSPSTRFAFPIFAGASLLAVAVALYQTPRASFDAAPATENVDDRDPELPRYRIADVRKHDGSSANPWVIYCDKVYDITEWIPAHPGGEVILRAAGGSIDPYWDIFTIHKSDYVLEILSNYLIGYVDPADLVDGRPAQEQIEDPFADDPARDPSLITRTAKPRNAETPGEAMNANFLTPNELFYIRNHMWVPQVAQDPDTHLLTVELLDGTTKQYTLHDLKSKFPRRAVTAAMQCSGNRRRDMSAGSGRPTNGLQWTAGAISNATWEGASLADVLADAGFALGDALAGEGEVRHVQFSGMEAYGASIPVKKAVDPQGDVLLAYAMNGKPLPRDHGFPLRAVVPGHVAARSVKWLSGITLSEEESSSQWQKKDYKCFGPNETQVDWDSAPAIQELPVQSAITKVRLGGWINAQPTDAAAADSSARQVSLSGYAYSGGGRAIIRVDISLDDGHTWHQAQLIRDCAPTPSSPTPSSPSPCHGHAAWAWQRWRFDGAVPSRAFVSEREGGRRCATLVVKATDDAYNTQPESHAATWNLRGNLATAWHRVRICADCKPGAAAEPSE